MVLGGPSRAICLLLYAARRFAHVFTGGPAQQALVSGLLNERSYAFERHKIGVPQFWIKLFDLILTEEVDA